MQKVSCFLIGHRDATDQIFPSLLDAVEEHIVKYGVTEFIVGHYGNFDRLSAKAVIAAKQVHPEITLTLLLPYHPAAHPIKVPNGFDNAYYPFVKENIPPKLAIVRSNRYMIDHVDYLITYAWQPASNTRKLIEYAERKSHAGKIKVFNIASAMEL